jgi:NADPH:quinone reductase-like Zn-dependent oxidoreductase
MKALQLEEKGKLDHLKLKQMDILRPGDSEVLVRLKAAALNHRDVWIIRGLYAKIKLPVILGSDGSGVIEAVGGGLDPGIKGKPVIINPALDWGDDARVQQKTFRILGMPDNGTQAEYVVVPAGNVVPMPAHLTFEEAAALPLAGLTGYRALFTRGNLTKKDRLLITGVGGGVAALIMQMAASIGSNVTVTSGNDNKIKKALEFGAVAGVNYRQEDWPAQLQQQTDGKGFDLIIDSAGGSGFTHLIDLVKPGGKIVIYGATAGMPGELNLRKIFWNQISILGSTMGNPDDFRQMVNFISENEIKPVIHSVYELADFKKAYQDMWECRQFGKIVLRISD